MTPKDIVTRAVQAIEGIRFPLARATVDRIFRELEEEGYVIIEASELRRVQGCQPQSLSIKATSSRSS